MNQHWWINVCYDLFHHLGSYRNIGQFQISSRRENRQRHTWVIKSHQEFLEKFSADIFALSDAEDSTYRPLNRAGLAHLPLLRTLLAICQKVLRAKCLGSDGFFCFINMCKFGSFKNPFAKITSLSELHFRLRRFILLVQTIKVISMNYGSSTSRWKPWRSVRLELILTMQDIYINWTH